MYFQLTKGKERKIKAFSILEIIIALTIVSILIFAFYSSSNNLFANLFKINEIESKNVRLSSVGMYIRNYAEKADLIFKNKNLGNVIMFCNKQNNGKYAYFFFRFSNNTVYYNAETDYGFSPDKLSKRFLKRISNNRNRIDSDISEFELTIEDDTLKIYLKNDTDEFVDYLRIFNYEEY